MNLRLKLLATLVLVSTSFTITAGSCRDGSETSTAASAGTEQIQGIASPTVELSATPVPTVSIEDIEAQLSPPAASEIIDFLDALPPARKAILDAQGWTAERIIALFGTPSPSIRELQRFLLPLLDIQISFLSEQVTFALNHVPSIMLSPLRDSIDQQVFDELKSGTRQPTGNEYLTIPEWLSAIEVSRFE